ncbi:hypothetical protein CBS101457_006325 [Exobasidium rhododendri]|nr:hypothetical protein CBS101457_006325 [Exobasidium rhododendri]
MSRGSSDRDKDLSEEARLTLHHDAASRLLAASGLPHLSSDHSQLLKLALVDGQAFSSTSSISPGAKSMKRRKANSGMTMATASSSFDFLPIHYQMHNPRCPSCDNALLLGINSSFAKDGIYCFSCGIHLSRSGPDINTKREYRSMRSRQQVSKKEVQRDAAVPEPTKKTQEEEVEHGPTRPETLTLEERAAKLRSEKKKKKEPRGVVAPQTTALVYAASATAEGGPSSKLSPDNELTSTVDTKRRPTKARPEKARPDRISDREDIEDTSIATPDPVKVPKVAAEKKKKELPWQKRDALRRMLSEKKTKQDQAKDSKQGNSGGLADFLGSL